MIFFLMEMLKTKQQLKLTVLTCIGRYFGSANGREGYAFLCWRTTKQFMHFPVSSGRLIFCCAMNNIQLGLHYSCGPGSVVGIATGYGLDGPGIESRWGARFSAPVQTGLRPTQPPAQWALGLSRGQRAARAWRWPHPLQVPWSWKGRAIPLLPLWAVRPVQSLSAYTRVHFTCFTYITVTYGMKTNAQTGRNCHCDSTALKKQRPFDN